MSILNPRIAVGLLPSKHMQALVTQAADHEQLMIKLIYVYGAELVAEVEGIIHRINTETIHNTGRKFRDDLYDFDPDLRAEFVAATLDGELPTNVWGVLATELRGVMTERHAARLRNVLDL